MLNPSKKAGTRYSANETAEPRRTATTYAGLPCDTSEAYLRESIIFPSVSVCCG